MRMFVKYIGFIVAVMLMISLMGGLLWLDYGCWRAAFPEQPTYAYWCYRFR